MNGNKNKMVAATFMVAGQEEKKQTADIKSAATDRL